MQRIPDILIYDSEGESTSVVEPVSVKQAIENFQAMNPDTKISEVFWFNRWNNDPAHRVKIDNWEDIVNGNAEEVVPPVDEDCDLQFDTES